MNSFPEAFMADVDDLSEDLQKELVIFESGGIIDLNNFRMKLPLLEGTRKKIEEMLPDVLDEMLSDGKGNSSLRLSQSNREFYKTIDEVVDSLGLMEVLKGFEEELVAHIAKRLPIMQSQDLQAQITIMVEGAEITKRINSAILPVYFRLRVMGYNSYPDLII